MNSKRSEGNRQKAQAECCLALDHLMSAADYLGKTGAPELRKAIASVAYLLDRVADNSTDLPIGRSRTPEPRRIRARAARRPPAKAARARV